MVRKGGRRRRQRVEEDPMAGTSNLVDAMLVIAQTRKSLQLTFVTTYGVKQNAYSGHVQKEILLEDLFE